MDAINVVEGLGLLAKYQAEIKVYGAPGLVVSDVVYETVNVAEDRQRLVKLGWYVVNNWWGFTAS